MNKLSIFLLLFLSVAYSVQSSNTNYARTTDRIWLDSKEVHQGEYIWKMMKVGDVEATAEEVSHLVIIRATGYRPLFREPCSILLCTIRSIPNPITG